MARKKVRETYDRLTLLPELVAEMVCQQIYTGEEISVQLRSARTVKEVECLRQAMTRDQVAIFAIACNKRCRAAYEVEADWFEECVTGGNRGRDQLYVWTSHWLSSFLTKGKIQ